MGHDDQFVYLGALQIVSDWHNRPIYVVGFFVF